MDKPAALRSLSSAMRYFARLTTGRLVLWCYLLWYLFFAARYFEASAAIWLTSAGLSGIVGVALYLSTTAGGYRPGFWPTFRLFLMPFCVSSFAALVKGRGFVLVFSPRVEENAAALALLAVFCLFVYWSGRLSSVRQPAGSSVDSGPTR